MHRLHCLPLADRYADAFLTYKRYVWSLQLSVQQIRLSIPRSWRSTRLSVQALYHVRRRQRTYRLLRRQWQTEFETVCATAETYTRENVCRLSDV